jgi:hypothetical protein
MKFKLLVSTVLTATLPRTGCGGSNATRLAESRRRGRGSIALALLVFVLAFPAGPAAADVGRFDIRPRAAAPGSTVELSFAAAWQQRFPISLVPLARAPEPFPCRGGEGLCTPGTLAPPRRPPFVFLGSVRPDPHSGSRYIYRYRFRFVVPDAKPGAYVFVLWCAGCFEGRRGSLIASALPSGGPKAGVLRISQSRSQWPLGQHMGQQAPQIPANSSVVRSRESRLKPCST